MSFPPWVHVMSLVHASLQTFWNLPTALQCLMRHQCVIDKYVYAQSMYVFMVYLSMDSILHWRKLGRAMQTHHLLFLGASMYNLYAGPPLPAVVLLSNECSTVFLSLVRLTPKSNPWKSRWFRGFGVSFFLSRIVGNAMLLHWATKKTTMDNIMIVSSALLLNTYWFANGIYSALR